MSRPCYPPAQCTAVSAERSVACRIRTTCAWLCLCRYQIVTCSGVVVRDGGTVTGIGVRIASASAAVVVSTAVVGAAIYGGTAISDPGAPTEDDRLIAVPAAQSAYPTDTPLETPPATPATSLRARPNDASTTHRASARPRPQKCNIHQRGSVCYRPLKSHAPATPVARSAHSPSTASTTPKRRSTAKHTHYAKLTPTTKPTPAASTSAPSKSASSASGYDKRTDWANAVLDELNSERAAHGLSALKLNSKLVDSAHTHNLDMAKADKLSHQLSGEAALGSRVSAAGYQWSMVGENIAYNSSRSGSGVLALQTAMYNEKPPNDGHRQNILNSKFVDVGIDVISDSVHGKVWLVTDFGRP
jgi:uncharacterized protein YkwD